MRSAERQPSHHHDLFPCASGWALLRRAGLACPAPLPPGSQRLAWLKVSGLGRLCRALAGQVGVGFCGYWSRL